MFRAKARPGNICFNPGLGLGILGCECVRRTKVSRMHVEKKAGREL